MLERLRGVKYVRFGSRGPQTSFPATVVRLPDAVDGRVALGVAACLLFAFAPHRDRYPAALLGIVAFSLLPLVMPGLRLLSATPVCPRNWAIVLFFLQLVVDPLLI